MSRRINKHGNAEKGTEVPRQTLVEQLNKGTDFFTTEERGRQLSKDFEIPPQG
jgi:hypothetical protein